MEDGAIVRHLRNCMMKLLLRMNFSSMDAMADMGRFGPAKCDAGIGGNYLS
jgi:hypothetical protein